jgi:hypothetical protein
LLGENKMEIPVMVTITNKEYTELVRRNTWLECLEQAGVDNWEGIEMAHEILAESIKATHEYNKDEEQ